MRRLLLAFALPPALLGLACLGIGGYATYEHLAFSRDATEATGSVVELVARPTGRTNPRFRHLPVVKFATANGQRVRFESPFRGDPPFRVGDQVAVLYPPSRPGQARLAAQWLTWGSKVRNWFVAGGVVALVASLAMVAGALRLGRRPRPSPSTR